MKRQTFALTASITVAILLNTAHAEIEVDPAISDYQPISGVTGNFSSVGSDTLANLITFWAEDYKRIYPSVNVQIQASGSSTAPPALTEGTSNIGPMSRKMKDVEVEAFEKHYGYQPTAIRVAIDALAVFVNKDNPIEGLTIAQVDAIFSANRKCGANDDITKWGELGLTGSWVDRPIQLFGRNSVSGTYGYFKEEALCKGDFRNNVNEQPGSASVVQSVSASLNGIGYSGIGYKTSSVRALPLAEDGVKFIEPNAKNATNKTYPLSRYLYVYINKHPNKPLGSLEKEFIKLILSKAGQRIVIKDGYIPLSKEIIEKELQKLD